jgi:hypothetical protein
MSTRHKAGVRRLDGLGVVGVLRQPGAEGGGAEGGLAPPNKLLVYLVFISSCVLISHYLLISIH